MRAAVADGDADALRMEQRMLALAAALLSAQTDADRRMARLPVRRASTREEIFRRLERAQDLLRSTDAPVTAVCLEPGFESLGAFVTLFGKTFGLSPRRYRLAGRKQA